MKIILLMRNVSPPTAIWNLTHRNQTSGQLKEFTEQYKIANKERATAWPDLITCKYRYNIIQAVAQLVFSVPLLNERK